MTKLFLDDIRYPPSHDWVIVRSYAEFVSYLESHQMPDIISFDHDLGTDMTGYDCAKYIVGNDLPLLTFTVHSANPVGKVNIETLLSNYLKHKNVT